MPDALTREDLDATGCGSPGCMHDHAVLTLFPHCHPKAGLVVRYDKRDCALHISCGRCDRLVVEVSVAARVVQ